MTHRTLGFRSHFVLKKTMLCCLEQKLPFAGSPVPYVPQSDADGLTPCGTSRGPVGRARGPCFTLSLHSMLPRGAMHDGCVMVV